MVFIDPGVCHNEKRESIKQIELTICTVRTRIMAFRRWSCLVKSIIFSFFVLCLGLKESVL